MKAIRNAIRVTAVIMFVVGLAVPESSAGGMGLKIALLVTSLLLATVSILVPAIKDEQASRIQFPKLSNEVFADQRDYDEWRKFAREGDDYSRVVWWAFSLSPDEFLHFTRLVIELRYMADQKGLDYVAKYMRKDQS